MEACTYRTEIFGEGVEACTDRTEIFEGGMENCTERTGTPGRVYAYQREYRRHASVRTRPTAPLEGRLLSDTNIFLHTQERFRVFDMLPACHLFFSSPKANEYSMSRWPLRRWPYKRCNALPWRTWSYNAVRFQRYCCDIPVCQGGTAEDDVFEAVDCTSNNTVVFAGYTGGSWNVTNIGGKDFVAVKTLDIFSATEEPTTSTDGGSSSSQKETSLLLAGLSILAAIVIVTVWGYFTRKPAAQRNANNPSTSGGQSGDPENGCGPLAVAQ